MKKWIYYTAIAVLIAVFLFSSYKLVHYYTQSAQQKKVYDDLSQIMASAVQEPESVQGEATVPSPYVTVTHPETGQQRQILQEFEALYELNPDIVGWLSIPGTNIDYPVMQTPQSPNYYLKRDFYKTSSTHGCIYAAESCDVFAPSDNVTLYGHRMKDGSMFAGLADYKKKDFWQENSTLQFRTLESLGEYEIFAVFLTTASQDEGFSYQDFVDAPDQATFDRFVADVKSLCLYDTGITPVYGDKLLTLSTCDYTSQNGRLVVMARLL